jgi:hypothetical protein
VKIYGNYGQFTGEFTRNSQNGPQAAVCLKCLQSSLVSLPGYCPSPGFFAARPVEYVGCFVHWNDGFGKGFNSRQREPNWPQEPKYANALSVCAENAFNWGTFYFGLRDSHLTGTRTEADCYYAPNVRDAPPRHNSGVPGGDKVDDAHCRGGPAITWEGVTYPYLGSGYRQPVVDACGGVNCNSYTWPVHARYRIVPDSTVYDHLGRFTGWLG